VSRAAVTPKPTPAPACAVTDVGIATTTSSSHYSSVPRQDVPISVAVRNLTSHGCVFSAPGDLAVLDTAEGSVFTIHLQCPAAGCAPLPPGATSTYSIVWNQLANQGNAVGAQVKPGTYHARATFADSYPAATSAPFSIS